MDSTQSVVVEELFPEDVRKRLVFSVWFAALYPCIVMREALLSHALHHALLSSRYVTRCCCDCSTVCHRLYLSVLCGVQDLLRVGLWLARGALADLWPASLVESR